MKKTSFDEKVLSFVFGFILLIMPFECKYERIVRKFYFLLTHQKNIPELIKKTGYFYATEIIIIFLGLYFLFRYRSLIKEYFFSGPVKYLSFFVLLSIFSLFQTPENSFLFKVINSARIIFPILLVSSIYFVYSKETIRDLIKIIFIVIFFVTIVESTIAICQYFLQGPVGLRLFGEVNISLTDNINVVRTASQNGSRWIFDNLFHVDRHIDVILRSYGTFDHPNILGGFLVFGVIVSYCLFCLAKNKWMKIGIAISLFFSIFTLFITFSRAALFAWIIASFCWFLLFIYTNDTMKYSNIRLLIIITASSALLSTTLLFPQIYQRGGIVNYSEYVKGVDAIRLEQQKICYEIIKSKPINGVGINNYDLVKENYATKNSDRFKAYSHNIYLLIGAEVGVIGLICFMLYLINSLFVSFYKKEKDVFTISLFSIVIAFLFIGMCDYYLYQFQVGRIMLFTSTSLLCCFGKQKTLLKAEEKCCC